MIARVSRCALEQTSFSSKYKDLVCLKCIVLSFRSIFINEFRQRVLRTNNSMTKTWERRFPLLLKASVWLYKRIAPLMQLSSLVCHRSWLLAALATNNARINTSKKNKLRIYITQGQYHINRPPKMCRTLASRITSWWFRSRLTNRVHATTHHRQITHKT